MPSMEMNQAEQDMEKPKGQQAFTNRVAEEYSKTKAVESALWKRTICRP